MKLFRLFLFINCCFIVFSSFAQSPKAIEADLLRSFKKIDYWNKQRSKDTTMAWSDSLENANDIFGKKLQYCTRKYPFTINYKYSSFSNSHLTINTSSDGNLAIYSWDTLTGGSMHNFSNVLQYRYVKTTYSILDTASGDSEKYIYCYSYLFTLNANNHIYYMALYYGIFSGKERGEGVRIFSIENGKLIDAKIIKTQSGLHNKLYYGYDLFSIPLKMKDAEIHYDPALKTISLAVVADEKGTVTNGRIIYKFNGQYFEMVKN
jgi:hypothetical protein